MSVVSSVQASTGSTTYVEQKNDDLGRDDFLKLFLAQLSNQDPLNPMDDKDMSAQLAQFSSLEQLYNVNENLEGLMDIQDENNKLSALNLIGKEVTARGDQLILNEGETAKGVFALTEKADCMVTIRDENKNVVRTLDLKWLEAGERSFTWDGHNTDGDLLPAGTYTYEVTAVNSKGEELSVTTAFTGRVTKIQYVNGEPILFIGQTAITLAQLISIEPSES